MLKEKIPVGYYFKTYQRVILLFIILFLLFKSIKAFLPIDAYDHYHFGTKSKLFVGLSVIIFLILMLKKGLIISNLHLHKAFFIFYVPVYKKMVGLKNKTNIILLNSEGEQIKEEDTINNNVQNEIPYDIYLVNNDRSHKQFLINIKNSKIGDFIIENLSQMYDLERI